MGTLSPSEPFILWFTQLNLSSQLRAGPETERPPSVWGSAPGTVSSGQSALERHTPLSGPSIFQCHGGVFWEGKLKFL